MHILVPIIIVVIICVQIFFFVQNLKRMNQFSQIFSCATSWRLRHNTESGLVNGVYGVGNAIFDSIKDSINKYLGNNTGSVIDFGLLKDAVDRHCDSVENDIATQTPIPLYWGLAGTMAGVIFGLWDLLDSDAIATLMGSGTGQIDSNAKEAAKGIDALLSGVAWAMGASIVGIILTTVNSILFKRCKLKEESGKNSFLAWMQSELLPELPSDTSQALNNLVKNLNKFNATFASNTTNLGHALEAVNQSYKIQADIIQAVHDMDVMKMAKANVRVLQELKECTDKLEVFNQYLSDIKGYTDAIHRFEAQFAEQANRLKTLEDLRDFFNTHKQAIAKATTDADAALVNSFKTIKEHTATNVDEMRKTFTEQSAQFKDILRQEKEAFEEFTSQLNTQFSAQMSKMPQMSKQLGEISEIPQRLDKLIERIEKSNAHLSKDIAAALIQVAQSNKKQNYASGNGDGSTVVVNSMPDWMKWTGISALVIIAAGCVFNVVVYFMQQTNVTETLDETQTESSATTDSTNVDSIKTDSVAAVPDTVVKPTNPHPKP